MDTQLSAVITALPYLLAGVGNTALIVAAAMFIGLVIGVDRILDMLRTAVNVYGDTCVAVLVAKSEGETLPIDR